MGRRVSKYLRNLLKELYNFRCIKCDAYFKVKRLTAHHIVKKEHGGEDTIENLAMLCLQCHNRWHNKIEATWAKQNPEQSVADNFWRWIESGS